MTNWASVFENCLILRKVDLGIERLYLWMEIGEMSMLGLVSRIWILWSKGLPNINAV